MDEEFDAIVARATNALSARARSPTGDCRAAERRPPSDLRTVTTNGGRLTS